jgi:hypothetical protein
MTFRQLDEIANNQLCPMYVNPAPVETPAVPKDDRAPVINVPVPTDRNPSVSPGSGAPPATPPTPSVNPSSTSLIRPTVTPALVKVSPARPVMSPTPDSPVASSKPGVYQPIVKKPVTPTVTGSIAKAPSAKPLVVTPPSLGQDPLGNMPSSLDQDLFRTGTSPRP